MKRIAIIIVLIVIVVYQFSNPERHGAQGIDSGKLNISGKVIQCK